jgi:hypothetical protein
MNRVNSPSVKQEQLPPSSTIVKRYDHDGNNNLIYEGWADATIVANSTNPDACPIWSIRKMTYDGNNNIIRETLPVVPDNSNGIQSLSNGTISAMTLLATTGMKFVWNDRATLTYA